MQQQGISVSLLTRIVCPFPCHEYFLARSSIENLGEVTAYNFQVIVGPLEFRDEAVSVVDQRGRCVEPDLRCRILVCIAK